MPSLTSLVPFLGSRRTIAPYGTWSSPITPELLTSKAISFGELLTLPNPQGKASHLFYIENRPSEKGRAALISHNLASAISTDLTRGQYNARSGVHEYGGGALAGSQKDGSVIFTDYKPNDWGVYRIRNPLDPYSDTVERITPDSHPALRFANFAPHPLHPHLIAAVQEDHTIDEPSKVINSLVLINAETKHITTLHSGFDFYAHPVWSPNAHLLAWVTWQHPSMPFWATQLWVARSQQNGDDIQLTNAQAVAGHEGTDQVVHQPLWLPTEDVSDPSNTLVFTSDTTGYSNPYKVQITAAETGIRVDSPASILHRPVQADFLAPAWTLNNSSIVALSPDLLACTLTRGSSDRLALLVPSTGKLKRLDTPYISYSQLRRVSDTSIAAIVGAPDQVPSLVVIDLTEAVTTDVSVYIAYPSVAAHPLKISPRKHVRLVHQSSDLISSGQISKEYLSIPKDIEFPTSLPDGTQATAHAIYFPPTNPRFSAPAASSPPCILKIHGGPTSSASKQLSLQINFWTSRGYAVCYVNYGGSTGYGRDYMLRLMDNWGLVDVLDCAAAVRYLGTSRDPFAYRASDKFEKIRDHFSKTAAEELKQVKITHDADGSVRVTLPASGPTLNLWDFWATLVADWAAITARPLALRFLPKEFSSRKLWRGVFAAGYFVSKLFTSVLRESVWASPTLGVQIETKRGFRLPFTKKEIVTSTSTRHIPRDRVLEFGLHSAVVRWEVQDYLALSLRSQPIGSHQDGPVGRSQQLLFQHSLPRLPVARKIYEALYPVLFPASSNPVASSDEKDAGVSATDGSAVPPLQPITRSSSKFQSPANRLLPPLADPSKMIISGGSAGGFTVLACLTQHPSLFSAGTSSYGVADLKALAQESHKFESQYPFRLLSGTPEEVPEVYHDRSPLFHADRITAPLLVLQGSEDKIVPPNQARMMVDKIKSTEGGEDRVKYIEFEGEGHGFRQSQNVVTALVEEEQWYQVKLRLDK